LGDSKSVDLITPLLARGEKQVRVEAIQALARLADEARAEHIRAQLQAQSEHQDATVARAAMRALTELEVRFSSGAGIPGVLATGSSAQVARPAGMTAAAGLAGGS